MSGAWASRKRGFEDATVFESIDVNSELFDPNSLYYYYAVVPVDAMGLMGTPSIVSNSITPSVATTSEAPSFFIHTQPHGTGEWHVEVQSTQPLQSAPYLTVDSPNRNGYTIFLTQEAETKWIGTLRTNGFPPTGIYLYKIRGQTPAGVTGTRIWEGQTFSYVASRSNQNVTVAPNPLRAGQGTHLTFYPKGLTVEIYDALGNLIKVLNNASQWDCTNASGEMVCTGLYFFRATDGNGFQSTGKFCVVK